MFDATVADGVLQVARPGARWLSTGFDGGFAAADAAYNVSVPEGWDRRDLAAYAADRRERAGFDADGPTLLTGVDLDHARGARRGPVVAYATVGLSNPAALPMDPSGETTEAPDTASERPAGTVNVLLGTTRALDDGALANLATVAAEAKAATLLDAAGFPGTTTDAVAVACDGDGDRADFSGSATPVGAAARACVRDAVRASFESRYGDGADDDPPDAVADAEHGVVTDGRAEVFEP